ncbi:hypothetical protein ABHN11_31150 [Brevibacillus centrosporus]|jgi:tetratricopeptide (TPR) repeat protein|uniref:tetratricopeptide repeat protein n=1 Tax=Brevibacillus centrosporus TaxID=54910 RepID=UPI0039865634
MDKKTHSATIANASSTLINTSSNVVIDIGNALRLLTDLIENEEWHNALAWVNKIHVDSIHNAEYKGTYLWAKAKCFDFLGEQEGIELMYLQSIDLLQNSDDPFPLIRSLVSLSSYYCYSGQAKKARPLLDKAYQLVTQHDISGNTRISVLYATGIMHGRLHQHTVALDYFYEIEGLIKQGRTFTNNGSYQMAIGYSSIYTKQFANAENHYLLAHSIFVASNDFARVGMCCKYLGIVYRELNRFYLADFYLKQALDIFFSHNMLDHYYQAKVDQAILLMRTNKDAEAKKICLELLDYRKDDVRAEVNYLLSKIYYNEKQIEESMIHLEKALPFFQNNDHRWLTEAISYRQILQ